MWRGEGSVCEKKLGRWIGGWVDRGTGGLMQGPGRSIEGLYQLEVKNNLIDWQTRDLMGRLLVRVSDLRERAERFGLFARVRRSIISVRLHHRQRCEAAARTKASKRAAINPPICMNPANLLLLASCFLLFPLYVVRLYTS